MPGELFLHVLKGQCGWCGIRDCTDKIAEESETVSFGTDRGGEDLGDPDECRAVHKLEADDVDVDDGYTGCESGFVVGSQILVLKDTFEEQTARQRGEANHCLECFISIEASAGLDTQYSRNMVLRPILSTVKIATKTKNVPMVV